MTKQVRLLVSKFEGKWIAQEMRAQKVEGFSFGTFGVETRNLGRFTTKKQALEAVAERKAALTA